MTTKPTILILVGITGDLSKRKLLPAIDSLKEKGLLPAQFKLLGITRREGVNIPGAETFKMDLDATPDYMKLKERLEAIEKEFGVPAQRLFYLSVAPTVSMPIIEQLDMSGLSKVVNTKLLLEKPFGIDQANGEMLVHNIENFFTSEQVYRIDHYLQKDSVRALLVKPSFAKLTSGTVERIEIVASEKIGIEGRGDFYEQTGALRDFIQSHLLEVAAMAIHPTERLQALKSFFIPTDKPIAEYVKRGQYKGYREAVKNPDSVVETFVSVILQSHNLLLEGLTIVLKTGKELDKKNTDITIFYKDGTKEIISLNDTHNAYENVFEDAMNDNKTFFVSKEEVLENWRIITPIQEAWKKNSSDLFFYEEGSSM